MKKIPKTFNEVVKVDLTGKTDAQAAKLRQKLFTQPNIHPAVKRMIGKDDIVILFIKWIWGKWEKFALATRNKEMEQFTNRFRVDTKANR
jgi:hypothetical protein